MQGLVLLALCCVLRGLAQGGGSQWQKAKGFGCSLGIKRGMQSQLFPIIAV